MEKRESCEFACRLVSVKRKHRCGTKYGEIKKIVLKDGITIWGTKEVRFILEVKRDVIVRVFDKEVVEVDMLEQWVNSYTV